MATVTNYAKLGDLNNRNVFSSSCGGQNSKIMLSSAVLPSEALGETPFL